MYKMGKANIVTWKDLNEVMKRKWGEEEYQRVLARIEQNKKETQDAPLEMYGKKDIMGAFECKSDKALRILRLAYNMKFATKLGNEYYIKKEDFGDFMEQLKGRNPNI